MKIWTAVLIGFLLGAIFQPIPSLKAQIPRTTEMGVHIRHMGGNWMTANKGDGNIPGSQVVGFSCLREEDQTMCYIASKD